MATKQISKFDLSNDEVVKFVLTKNQFQVADFINKNRIDYPIIGLGFSHKTVDLSINKVQLLLFSLYSWDKIEYLYREAKSDDLLLKNNIRLFEFIGISNVLDLLPNFKVAIKFNDHGPHSTYLFDKLKEKNTKCVFIQHSTTGKYMPNILYHDLNYLFSQQSAEHYDNKDNRVRFILGCDLRIKKLEFEITHESEGNAILIATNELDRLEPVIECIEKLKKAFPERKIIYRPHPRDKRKLKTNLVDEISNKKLPVDLARSEMVLTNESGIALEALAVGKFFYKCSFFSKNIDNYGFLENELIQNHFQNIDELIKAISNKEITYSKSKLQHFVGNLDTFNETMIFLKMEINQLKS
ncbi:hypothetical protein [Gracilimonas tropica]|uniref:hypothetical protein n=1 Tax=Gracilimonas tropica TaxID=454600 RepID=UPI0012FBAD88|nr:hypothetical protein [Gracilimonas tropica]